MCRVRKDFPFSSRKRMCVRVAGVYLRAVLKIVGGLAYAIGGRSLYGYRLYEKRAPLLTTRKWNHADRES